MFLLENLNKNTTGKSQDVSNIKKNDETSDDEEDDEDDGVGAAKSNDFLTNLKENFFNQLINLWKIVIVCL